MEIPPVNQCDVDRSMLQRLGCTESSKTSANDDYVGPCTQDDTSHEQLIFATTDLGGFPADIRTLAPGMPKPAKHANSFRMKGHGTDVPLQERVESRNCRKTGTTTL